MMENLTADSNSAEEFSKYPDGAFSDGEFKGGKPEGIGVYKYPDGAVYDGEYKSGLREWQRSL